MVIKKDSEKDSLMEIAMEKQTVISKAISKVKPIPHLGKDSHLDLLKDLCLVTQTDLTKLKVKHLAICSD